MELVPKQGWIFVDTLDVRKDISFDVSSSMRCGRVQSGIKEIGMIVFFKEFIVFNDNSSLALVKIDDVLAWVKPEVSVDDSENNQA